MGVVETGDEADMHWPARMQGNFSEHSIREEAHPTAVGGEKRPRRDSLGPRNSSRFEIVLRPHVQLSDAGLLAHVDDLPPIRGDYQIGHRPSGAHSDIRRGSHNQSRDRPCSKASRPEENSGTDEDQHSGQKSQAGIPTIPHYLPVAIRLDIVL